MKPPLLIGVALLSLSLGTPPVLAGASVSERALQMAETDLSYSGRLDFAMDRTYFSGSSHPGLFGPGWESRYESRITEEANGSLVVRECGCAPSVTFQPVQGRPGLWEGQNCGHQTITRTPQGFERHLTTGMTESFAADGRLQRIADANGNWITVRYEAGNISAVEDNVGRVMAFSYGPDGHLDRISGEGGRSVAYRFDNEGRLLGVTSSDGTEHRYTYDNTGLLATSDTADGRQMMATYESGLVSSFTENGRVHRYRGDEGIGWREMTQETRDTEGHGVYLTRRVQLFQTDANGRRRVWRELTNHDGRQTDTEFNDFGLPAIIHTGNGHSGGFRYDSSGRLIHKETSDEVLDVRYDPRLGKISSVQRKVGRSVTWSRFSYDDRGNLTTASDSEGHKALLTYDGHGNITEVRERTRRLTLTYNRNSKPETITLKNVGTIRVAYDGKGEIAHVESESGTVMALKVTAVFQNLLKIIEPAKIKVHL